MNIIRMNPNILCKIAENAKKNISKSFANNNFGNNINQVNNIFDERPNFESQDNNAFSTDLNTLFNDNIYQTDLTIEGTLYVKKTVFLKIEL